MSDGPLEIARGVRNWTPGVVRLLLEALGQLALLPLRLVLSSLTAPWRRRKLRQHILHHAARVPPDLRPCPDERD